MTKEQLLDVLNTYSHMFPSFFKDVENAKRKEKYYEIWNTSLAQYEYEDVKAGLQWLFENNETNYAPNMKAIIDSSRVAKRHRLNGKGINEYRIQTSEEVIYKEVFLPLLDKKGKTKKDWDTLNNLKKYAELFSGDGWEERYKRYFNTTKTRRQYEALN